MKWPVTERISTTRWIERRAAAGGGTGGDSLRLQRRGELRQLLLYNAAMLREVQNRHPRKRKIEVKVKKDTDNRYMDK